MHVLVSAHVQTLNKYLNNQNIFCSYITFKEHFSMIEILCAKTENILLQIPVCKAYKKHLKKYIFIYMADFHIYMCNQKCIIHVYDHYDV